MNDTFIKDIERATRQGKMDWTANGSGFSAKLGAGSIGLSMPVSDQRDGDFCWLALFDANRKEVSKTSIQPALYHLIAGGPKQDLMTSMLQDLDGRIHP